MATEKPTEIQVPGGCVAMTSYGSVQSETLSCWGAMREATTRAGLNVEYIVVPGSLVDRARNNAVMSFLQMQPARGWLLFVDGDASFDPNALNQILAFAYGEGKIADAVGGYCTLRGEPYLPTIDTGTGTWESVLPGQGPVEVMRTGSAFILLKRHCFEKVPGPWYGTRNPMRAIDALMEVDNFAHTRFDGKNPLADTVEWQTLLKCALDDPSTRAPMSPTAFVGEDSNWCDLMRFHGLRIFVHTDIEVHHVDKVIRSAKDHRECMEKVETMTRTLVGAKA